MADRDERKLDKHEKRRSREDHVTRKEKHRHHTSSSSSSSSSTSRSRSRSPKERHRKRKHRSRSPSESSDSSSSSRSSTREHKHKRRRKDDRKYKTKHKKEKQKRKRTKTKKARRKSSEGGPVGGPVQLSKFMQKKEEGDDVHRSAVTGKVIKMKVRKSSKDKEREVNRKQFLDFLNASIS